MAPVELYEGKHTVVVKRANSHDFKQAFVMKAHQEATLKVEFHAPGEMSTFSFCT